MNLFVYNKLITALVGLALLLANRHFGFDLAAHGPAIVDLVIATLTAAGIYGVPNKQPAKEKPTAAADPKQEGRSSIGFSAFLLACVLLATLPGCGTLQALTAPAPLPPVDQSLPPLAQEAQKLIREAHIGIAAAANVIRVNLRERVWTPQEAQAYLDQVKAYRKRAVQAEELLDKDLFQLAHTEARVLESLILVLQREVAAAARKEKP